ncbi:MAG TPA: glutathione S-transferase family protein [Rhizomicrobium sp.]
MTIKLYYHPLSSFCWKALIALYENDTPFEPVLVDLQDPVERGKFLKIWALGKFPVIVDGNRNDWLVPESSIIIEYLAQYYPGKSKLVPADPDMARRVRMVDRFFDFNIHIHMQKIVGDRMRPEGGRDPIGVEYARGQIRTALGMFDRQVASNQWAMGDTFTMADVSAAPALFYGNSVAPFCDLKNISAYLERLKQRPSFARVLKEAEPYFAMFPKD